MRYLNPGGKIFADAGYVSQKLFEKLFEQELRLFTKIRKNMKNKLIIRNASLLHGAFALQTGQNQDWNLSCHTAFRTLACASAKSSYARTLHLPCRMTS